MEGITLIPAGFVSEVTSAVTDTLSANIGVITGLLAVSIGIGFALRAFKRARGSVAGQGGKI